MRSSFDYGIEGFFCHVRTIFRGTATTLTKWGCEADKTSRRVPLMARLTEENTITTNEDTQVSTVEVRATCAGPTCNQRPHHDVVMLCVRDHDHGGDADDGGRPPSHTTAESHTRRTPATITATNGPDPPPQPTILRPAHKSEVPPPPPPPPVR